MHMSEITQHLPQVANSNGASKWELDSFFEAEINKPSVTAQMKTTVSKLAIILPAFFMSEKDPSRMVKMLEETRDEIWGVGQFDEAKPILKQNFTPANNNSSIEKAA